MEAQISFGTWALLLVPMLGVVVLSLVSLLRSQPAAEIADPPPAPKTSEGAGSP